MDIQGLAKKHEKKVVGLAVGSVLGWFRASTICLELSPVETLSSAVIACSTATLVILELGILDQGGSISTVWYT